MEDIHAIIKICLELVATDMGGTPMKPSNLNECGSMEVCLIADERLGRKKVRREAEFENLERERGVELKAKGGECGAFAISIRRTGFLEELYIQRKIFIRLFGEVGKMNLGGVIGYFLFDDPTSSSDASGDLSKPKVGEVPPNSLGGKGLK